jgi:hypothetical protein
MSAVDSGFCATANYSGIRIDGELTPAPAVRTLLWHNQIDGGVHPQSHQEAEGLAVSQPG